MILMRKYFNINEQKVNLINKLNLNKKINQNKNGISFIVD